MAKQPTSLQICSLDELPIELPDDIRQFLLKQYNNDPVTLQSVLDAMKRPPMSTMCRVNNVLSSREEVKKDLEIFLKDYPLLEVTEHTLFDDVLSVQLKDREAPRDMNYNSRTPPPPEEEHEATDEMRWSTRQRIGWPMRHRVILCDRFCAEAVLRGSDIFVRGVLAADAGIKMGETVAVYADIRAPHLTAVTRGLFLEHYVGRCIYLGLGVAACNRAEFFREHQGIGIRMSQLPSERVGPCLPPFSGIFPDKVMLQNLPSIFVGHVLDPKPGDTIMDMCAAPGGKSAHLASLVRNQATIVSCDKKRKKILGARDLFATLGITCIAPLVLNSTKCVDNSAGQKQTVHEILDSAELHPQDGLKVVKKFPPETFDRILLDPPCSALGLRPKLFVVHETLESLQSHATYQRKFISQAVQLLKPGGRLTYSTCTISAAENEEMIRHILDEYPEMELLPIPIPLGQPGLPNHGLSDEERQKVKRFDPHNAEADTMGFFVALLQKKADMSSTVN